MRYTLGPVHFSWRTSVAKPARLHCIVVHQPICYHCQRCHSETFTDWRELPYTLHLYCQHSLVSRTLLVRSAVGSQALLPSGVFVVQRSLRAGVQMQPCRRFHMSKCCDLFMFLRRRDTLQMHRQQSSCTKAGSVCCNCLLDV